jgi:hypothetical protein
MPRTMKFCDEIRASMGRRYEFGESPSEIARDYGASAAYVINVARDYRRNMQIRRLKSQNARLRRELKPPPIEPDDDDLPTLKWKDIGINQPWRERHPKPITLPRVSILENKRTLKEAR